MSLMQAVRTLFTPQYSKQITIGIVLQVAQQLSGINAVMFYSSSIFRYGNQNTYVLRSLLIC